nr:hypothetical protein [Candidatus Eremiobacteraeota bacterium]
ALVISVAIVAPAAAQPRPGAIRTARATRADSGLDTQGLVGSARVALDASSTRIDGGQFTSGSLSAAALPFVSEHLQVGLAPTYTVTTASHPATPVQPAGSQTYQSYGVGLTANYVVGGGRRWRGYAGGYAFERGATHVPGASQLGAQAGALYFLDPAVAVRAELRYRVPSSGSGPRHGSGVAFLTLDPYLFGRASTGGATRAGLGTADVRVFAYHQSSWYGQQSGISGIIAPYLTPWAQVGVEGEAVSFSEFGGRGVSGVREFVRGYLPLAARTQPFAEVFRQHGTDAILQPASGWTVGVRQLLAPRVALDVGVRRTIPTPITLDQALGYRFRLPGETGLVLGLTTRLGRLR